MGDVRFVHATLRPAFGSRLGLRGWGCVPAAAAGRAQGRAADPEPRKPGLPPTRNSVFPNKSVSSFEGTPRTPQRQLAHVAGSDANPKTDADPPEERAALRRLRPRSFRVRREIPPGRPAPDLGRDPAPRARRGERLHRFAPAGADVSQRRNEKYGKNGRLPGYPLGRKKVKQIKKNSRDFSWRQQKVNAKLLFEMA